MTVSSSSSLHPCYTRRMVTTEHAQVVSCTFSETLVSKEVHIGVFGTSHEDPFGNIIRSTGPAADDNPFRFSTKYHDEETGLVYYGYRYYDPELGRWLSRDPIGKRGGVNLYVYASNSPTRYSDLLGMFAIDDGIRGVSHCGVLLYLTHTYNAKTLDFAGSRGCRRAGIVSCHSKGVVPNLPGQENLIDIPLSAGNVGISDIADNGGHGKGLNGFMAYMTEVMTDAKKAAEGLCPPKHFLKQCAHDDAECACKTCDRYREEASEGLYSEGHWLHYDRDTHQCCDCETITFKFVVPESDDNETFLKIIGKTSGRWAAEIGIGNDGQRTYDCREGKWSQGVGSGGVF